MDMLKSKEGLVAEIQLLRGKLKNSRDQNSVLSDQLLLLQKECKNLLNSISTYEDSNHKLITQVARLNEKNLQLKKKLKQSISACSDIKKQAEGYISSIQSRFYEQMSRVNTFVNNKKDTEENETSNSFTSLSPQTPFRYDSPAISVSERENDSSIARHDNEEIILAYTQEIKDKQTEISMLSRNLEQKNYDYENFKSNYQGLKDNYEKRIAEKDRIIFNLQQEVQNLNEEISNYQKSNKDVLEINKLGQSMSERKLQGHKQNIEESHTQIESLQLKVSNQAKKFDNYIRTIANLEKQVQLQIIKYSELEASNKNTIDALQTAENDKKELLLELENTEKKILELESLKIQQAKVINEQSIKINNYKNIDESQGALANLRRKNESLEEESQKLKEANEFIQNYIDNFKSNKENEIATLREEMRKKIEQLEKLLEDKNEKISEMALELSQTISSLNINEKDLTISHNRIWKKIKEFLSDEFKEKNPELLLDKLKDMTSSISRLKYIYENLDESSDVGVLTKVKNVIAESKLIEIFFDDFAISGKNLTEKLENLSWIIHVKLKNNPLVNIKNEEQEGTIKIFDDSDIKKIIERLFKDFSNHNLSLIAKISNYVQKLNLRVADIAQQFKGKKSLEANKEKFQLNQISDYEITTVHECSEIDDESFSEDYELKVAMSAKRIKELNDEISQLKEMLEGKDDNIHSLQMKYANLQKTKEKLNKQCSSLQDRAAELENEIKTNKEIYEISDKKKSNMIASLENRINVMKKDYESLKNSIVSEKDELFDHIIRIEQESKNQIIW